MGHACDLAKACCRGSVCEGEASAATGERVGSMKYVLFLVALLTLCGIAQANNVIAVTVGTSSAQALAKPVIAYRMLAIDNESATANIACSFGGTAALNTAGSYTIPAGLTRTWAAPGWTMNQAINCISDTASTPVTIEYQ